MSSLLVALVSALFVQNSHQQVAIKNSSCTEMLANNTMVLTNVAAACSDQLDTNTCGTLFNAADGIYKGGAEAGAGYRPQSLATVTSACEDPGKINAAAILCPKYCGFCCLTPEFNCENTTPSPTPCDEVTTAMCNSPQWRPTLAQYCPASCGLCLTGGCIDAVTGCTNGGSAICFSMPTFAAANCQRTCKLCSSTTAAAATTAAGATTAAPGVVTTAPGTATTATSCKDTSAACAAWSKNGFCTNTFYTATQRAQLCGATCKLC